MLPSDGHAIEQSGSLRGVRYRIMAPEWICQNEIVNVLLVLREATGREADLVARLTPPREGFSKEPQTAGTRRLALAAGTTHRFAFTGYRADTASGEHEFVVTLRLPSDPHAEVRVPFKVRAVRGRAVPRGLWSIIVPAAISVLALPVFALFLSRASQRGAWRSATQAEISALSSREDESWWTEKNG